MHTTCCLFIPLLMDLWWRPPLKIVNSAFMTVGVGIFLQESVFSSFGSGPRRKISGSRNSSIFNFLRKLYCFPSWLYHFMCPPTSTSLLGLVFSCFFDSGHPTKCEPLFIVMLTYIPRTMSGVVHLFMCLFAICISPLEKSVEVLCPC